MYWLEIGQYLWIYIELFSLVYIKKTLYGMNRQSLFPLDFLSSLFSPLRRDLLTNSCQCDHKEWEKTTHKLSGKPDP